jgi:imidazolonepropionase
MNQTLTLTHATLAAMDPTGPWLRSDSALVLEGDRIAWAGPMADLPRRDGEARDLGGRLVTPALIDCHTHIVHAGHRAAEFEARLSGATYEEIARAGGGILGTVRATRAASEDDLVATALPRVDALLAEGVGTLEIKSGYGLDLDTELRMLRAARRIARERPVTVRTSFLGAHALPPGLPRPGDAYLDEVCLPALRATHEEGLADAVTASARDRLLPRQIARLFEEAPPPRTPRQAPRRAALASRRRVPRRPPRRAVGRPPRIRRPRGRRGHGERGHRRRPPPRRLLLLARAAGPTRPGLPRRGRPHGVATDCNPGSSPLASLLLAMNMACTLFRLTCREPGRARPATPPAPSASPTAAPSPPGLRADLAVWDADSPAELIYRMGERRLHARIHGGQWC